MHTRTSVETLWLSWLTRCVGTVLWVGRPFFMLSVLRLIPGGMIAWVQEDLLIVIESWDEGMPVRVVFEPLTDDVTLPKFRPA